MTAGQKQAVRRAQAALRRAEKEATKAYDGLIAAFPEYSTTDLGARMAAARAADEATRNRQALDSIAFQMGATR